MRIIFIGGPKDFARNSGRREGGHRETAALVQKIPQMKENSRHSVQAGAAPFQKVKFL